MTNVTSAYLPYKQLFCVSLERLPRELAKNVKHFFKVSNFHWTFLPRCFIVERSMHITITFQTMSVFAAWKRPDSHDTGCKPSAKLLGCEVIL